jgi:hypothetical protein
MTAEELARDTGFKKNLIWVYLNQCNKLGLIQEDGEKRNNFKSYTFVPFELIPKKLRLLYDLDKKILLKMIKRYAEIGIKMNFEKNEKDRILELSKEVIFDE